MSALQGPGAPLLSPPPSRPSTFVQHNKFAIPLAAGCIVGLTVALAVTTTMAGDTTLCAVTCSSTCGANCTLADAFDGLLVDDDACYFPLNVTGRWAPIDTGWHTGPPGQQSLFNYKWDGAFPLQLQCVDPDACTDNICDPYVAVSASCESKCVLVFNQECDDACGTGYTNYWLCPSSKCLKIAEKCESFPHLIETIY